MSTSVFEQTLCHYRQLAQLGEQLEAAIAVRDLDQVSQLAEAMSLLQETARTHDGGLLEVLGQDAALSQSPRLRELQSLMTGIRERNLRLVPQLQSIMAVHRDELHKMKQGNAMLQGYAAPSHQTGRRLSSAG